MKNCLRCAAETEQNVDILTRRKDMARGWFVVIKEKPICSADCANTIARKERVPGYQTGWRITGESTVTEAYI